MKDKHPLQGPARWLVLPGISAAAGALLFWWGGNPPEIAATGAILGAAPGIAAAASAHPAFAGLLAPAIAFFGLMASSFGFALGEGFEGSLRDFVLDFLRPSPNDFGLALLTIPPACLHAFRLKKGRSWASKNLLLQLGTSLGAAAVLSTPLEAVTAAHLVPFVLLALGHAVAVETADQVSRPV